MAHRTLLLLITALMWSAGAGVAQDLRLAAPQVMIEEGFLKHLLPRFGFKTRIKIAAFVDGSEPADLRFGVGEGTGDQVFKTATGTPVMLSIDTSDAERLAKIKSFTDWLASKPGQAAIEGFPAGGPSAYLIGEPEVEVVETVSLDGDVAKGSKLALLHCGRCHVVDQRNPFGGIGSTPSFSALRGRDGWSDLFLAFYVENPHPSFTQIEDVTEPFPANRPAHIAPLELTIEDIEAITAFVATMTPKDLGAAISPR